MEIKLTIGRKLILAIVMLLVLVSAISIVGIRGIDRVTKSTNVILRESSHLHTAHELMIAFERVLMPANDYLIHGDIEERANFEKLLKELKEKMDVTLKMAKEEHAIFFPEREETLFEATKGISEMEFLARKILNLSDPIGNSEGAKMMEEMDAIALTVSTYLDILTNFFNEDAKKAKDMANVTQRRAIKTTVILCVTIIFVGITGGLFFARGITYPLRQLMQVVQRVSSGDLTTRTEITSRDEIGDLAASFNKMTKDLEHLIQKEKELTAAERAKTAELEKAYKRLQEMQDMLIQAEKLNAVGQLASGVAHEVKNPLAMIIQGVNYLEKVISPKQNDAFEMLGMMEESVNRADKIICSLLDFSRATKLVLKPEDINSILESSLVLVKHKFKFENIEIIREAKENIPKISVDKNRMEQVFVNIFLNAIQAMPKGGKIIIRSYDKKLKEVKNGIGGRKEDHFKIGERAVMVEIEDTGSGISEESLKKIFDPFFTTRRPAGGTGLGLSVSRNIITMHKALIDMKSQIGEGTKVIITLKIA